MLKLCRVCVAVVNLRQLIITVTSLLTFSIHLRHCLLIFVRMSNLKIGQHFHDGCSYHIETSPLICSANQWTDFFMIGTSAMISL